MAEPAAASAPPFQADCTTYGRQLISQGPLLQVSCPAGCEANGKVEGTMVYTGASPVCRAGIHAGALPPSGGVMNVRIDPGRPAYRGTERNGIRSSDHPNYPTSFAVLVAGAPPPASWVEGGVVEAGCSFSGRDLRAELGKPYVVACPPGCAAAGDIAGTDTYAFDSPICKAAIHAGLLTDQAGGEVKVVVGEGRPSYRGGERNGVRSRDAASAMGSFQLQRP